MSFDLQCQSAYRLSRAQSQPGALTCTGIALHEPLFICAITGFFKRRHFCAYSGWFFEVLFRSLKEAIWRIEIWTVICDLQVTEPLDNTVLLSASGKDDFLRWYLPVLSATKELVHHRHQPPGCDSGFLGFGCQLPAHPAGNTWQVGGCWSLTLSRTVWRPLMVFLFHISNHFC